MLDASTLEPGKENVASERYFQIHRNETYAAMFIDRPSVSNLGEYLIVLSRRISKADGSFAGVVAGSIKLSYFHDLFRRVDAGENGSLTLVRRDGVIMMRTPFDVAMIGMDLSNKSTTRRLLSGEGGSFEGLGTVDKIPRQFVWSNGKQPLVIIVGKSLSAIYGPWKSQSLWIAGTMVILMLMASASMLKLLRETNKRVEIERRLALLAETDGLTGLSNRRRFDDDLEREWERSLRQRTPVALLMIDADNFKAYNDNLGHQAGDNVLSAIATCINDHVRRSGDCAARYGGEEFAVILPNLGLSEARIVAERIRKSVEILTTDKAAVATVSIGIASAIPASSHKATDLIAAADAALYEAKRTGRNRCVATGSDKIRLIHTAGKGVSP